MVVACAVVTCRNHNKNCDLSFFTFPVERKLCKSKEEEKLVSMRQAMWRKATGYKKPITYSVRICGQHFVSGRPAKLDEPGSIDWVPSLFLPEQPSSKMHGADADVIAAENEATESQQKQNTICSIEHCTSNRRPSWKTKIYPFPRLDTSNYVRRVLSEKRLLLWCQMLDQSTKWNKIDLCKLQLCSLHFTSGTMADLTDVGNVDWIPTLNMAKQTRFSDHVAYFDLYNLISLVKDSGTSVSGNVVTIDSYSTHSVPSSAAQSVNLPAAGAAAPITIPDDTPKIAVGLKCILCLSSTALKPLNQEHRKAIQLLFKDKLRVDSELICAMCSKFVFDYTTFYHKIIASQEKVTMRNPQKRTAVGLPSSSAAPAEKKPRSDEGTAKLFNLLVSNEFQCKLCYVTLSTRPGLNDHLYLAHKVKISCKLCKESFSPKGYAGHKAICLANIRAKRQAQKEVTVVIPAVSSTVVKPAVTRPVVVKLEAAKPAVIKSAQVNPAAVVKPPEIVVNESNEKHSCYICKKYYSPSEMVAHVKTHGIDTVPKQDAFKDYEVCKQCNKAIQKQNMSRHLEAHESHRNQMRKLIKEQEVKQRFQCSVCLLEFRTMALMEKHKEKHKLVTMEDKIECPDCNKVMLAKYFKYHVMHMHDQEQLPCDKCGKLFTRAGLKGHRATTCSDEDEVTCEQCGKSMRPHLLPGHVNKVHSTAKFKCDFCPKEYTSKEYKRSHERWSHREAVDKRKREGVKRLDLNRGQLEEVLGIRYESQEEDSTTCPVCLNVHGTKSFIEAHVRKAHSAEYTSMVMGGIVASTGDNRVEDFDAAQYISEVLAEETIEMDAM